MSNTNKVILLILLSEIWNVTGQIIFKKSTNTIDAGSMRGLSGHVKYIQNALTKNSIWLGFGFQVLCVATWILALAQADLSFVFPVGSIQYIFVLFGTYIFLGEKIDRMKLTGTFFVITGIFLITLS